MRKNLYLTLLVSATVFCACQSTKKEAAKTEPTSKIWTVDQANAWQKENGWLRGSNFNPKHCHQSAGNMASRIFRHHDNKPGTGLG